MTDGFYAIYYTGRTGSGFGVLVFKDSIITGADASGGLYDGGYTINQDKGTLEGTIKMKVPPGIALVTGVPASQHAYTQEIAISLPLELNQQQTLPVETPTGPINVNIKKLREFPS